MSYPKPVRRNRRSQQAMAREAWRLRRLEQLSLFPHCAGRNERVKCGGRRDAHHVRSRAQGGSDDLANLVTLCRNHHNYVHEGDREWARQKGLYAER